MPAEPAADESDEARLLAAAVSHLGEGVLITTDGLDWPGPKIVFVNKAMCAITGYEREELVGSTPRILQGPGTDREALDRLRDELHAGHPCGAELVNYRKDGTPYDAEMFITPLADQSGRRTNFVSIHRDITERKLVQNAIRDSDARTAAILASLSAHIAVVDRDGTIMAVNPAWEAFARETDGIAGCCKVGANYLEACQAAMGERADEAPDVARGLRAVLDGDAGEFRIEYACPSDSEDRWFLLQVTPLQSASGGAVISHTDISERVRAEQRLRESEERFRSIFENAVAGIAIEDPDGFFIHCNAAFCDIVGYREADLQEMDYSVLLHPDDRAANREYVRRLLQGELSSFEIERRYIRKDGRTVWVQAFVSILGTGAGEPANLVVLVIDITGRKSAEAAREGLATILDESLNEVYIFDAATLKFRQVNRSGRVNLGYSMRQLREMTPLDVKPGMDRKRFDALLEPLRTGARREVVYEGSHRRVDGSRYDVAEHLQFTEFRGKPCFVAITLDTTERRNLEQEVVNATEEERQRIACDIHDDLGSLLTGIKFRIEALRAERAATDGTDTRNCGDIAGLIGEAITKTRGIARGLRPVGSDPEDLMSALRSLGDRVNAAPDAHCRFRCSEPVLVDDPLVSNHLFRIGQEAVNNALKHGGGSEISIELRSTGECIDLIVEDDGIGFDPDAIREGGLGLHIMEYRARAVGATLHIQRRRRGGTRVACHLPARGAPVRRG